MYASNPNFPPQNASKSTRILEPLFPNNGSQPHINNGSEFESNGVGMDRENVTSSQFENLAKPKMSRINEDTGSKGEHTIEVE